MKEEKYDIKSRNPAELTEFVTGLGEKSFRAKQIFDWLHAKQVSDFEEMKNGIVLCINDRVVVMLAEKITF